MVPHARAASVGSSQVPQPLESPTKLGASAPLLKSLTKLGAPSNTAHKVRIRQESQRTLLADYRHLLRLTFPALLVYHGPSNTFPVHDMQFDLPRLHIGSSAPCFWDLRRSGAILDGRYGRKTSQRPLILILLGGQIEPAAVPATLWLMPSPWLHHADTRTTRC